MAQQRSESTSSTSGMFLMGLALGSVLTALFTPKSGNEMRKTIKYRADTTREKLKTSADDMRDKAEETMDKAKKAVSKNNDAKLTPTTAS